MFTQYKTSINWNGAVNLTKELIEIESYTCEGKREILNYVFDYLEGTERKIVKPAGAEPFLIAKIGSCKKKPSFTLILEGHLDTVPPGEMVKPFQPYLAQGKLFGRGTSDMKSGCAAMIYAFKEFSKRQGIAGEIFLVLVTDEETASKSIIEALTKHLPKGNLAVVGEPTGLNIGIAHKGIEWLELSFYGKACHASVPEEGINSINMTSDFIQILEEYKKEHFPARKHPICGVPTLTIGSIQGGEKFPNIVPEHCKLTIDRRWNPNEKIENVWNDLDKCLELCKKQIPDFAAEWKRIGSESSRLFPPLDFSKEKSLLSLVVESLKEVGDFLVECKGLTYWTEGSLLQQYEIPACVFGPGSIKQAHSAVEFVELQEIIYAAQGYFSIMLEASTIQSTIE